VLRASTDGDGKTISLSADGVSLANDVAVTNTAGWQEWTDITIPDVELQSGEQVLRLTIGATDYINLNYMTFIYHEIPLEPVQLREGWNLIGCPLEGSTDLQTAFSDIWNYVESVKNMDHFYLKDQPEFLNTLKTIVWGHGYLVKVSQNCELIWNPE
jgi:hypothetical protein